MHSELRARGWLTRRRAAGAARRARAGQGGRAGSMRALRGAREAVDAGVGRVQHPRGKWGVYCVCDVRRAVMSTSVQHMSPPRGAAGCVPCAHRPPPSRRRNPALGVAPSRTRSLSSSHTHTHTYPPIHAHTALGVAPLSSCSWRWGLHPLASVLIARRARVCAISTRSQPSRCSGGRITARMVAPLLRWLHRCMVSNDCVDSEAASFLGRSVNASTAAAPRTRSTRRARARAPARARQ